MELNLADYLSHHPELDLADVAYTLQIGRSAFRYRSLLLCRQKAEAITTLRASSTTSLLKASVERRDRTIGFLFPGSLPLNEQLLLQCRELYSQETSFKEAIQQCCTLLKPHLGIDLLTLLLTPSQESSLLAQSFLSEPILFSIEYALAQV
jgi:acyl transferase domain-containing protein